MFSTVRDVLSRFFGSDEVELTFITPTPTNAPVSPAEAQAATIPAEAPRLQGEVAERRGATSMVLRPVSQAE
ncbi:MAG: hypothetical protein U0841_04910 [Chloroflexia bacterium]